MDLTQYVLLINNQQDATNYPKFYFVTKLYMFRASTVPIIRSYQLYTWQSVCFMQVMWPLPRRVRLELRGLNFVEILLTLKRLLLGVISKLILEHLHEKQAVKPILGNISEITYSVCI